MSIFQLWKFQLLLSINCTKIPVARATDFSRFLTFMSGIYYRSPSWIKQLWISMTFCGQKCNQNQGSKLPCGLINKSEKVFFCNVPWIAKNSVRTSTDENTGKKSPLLLYLTRRFFFLIDEFCKSYSLTFVNLLLQKLAGSKFSHPWLMYISSKRHMNNYTKKAPLLHFIQLHY